MEIQGRWRGRGDGDEEKKKSFYDRRQVPSSAVNREDVTAKSDVGSVEECSKLEFTKDEVFALLSERAKAGKFDTKGKIEQMTDIIKRLKWTFHPFIIKSKKIYTVLIWCRVLAFLVFL
ncbi:hypothetical protein Bca52824_022646 [Brassica carinata]|uniref:Uncharacterized protein n=1 Tax=Brassica carinata TaxID=52824 RepID=A0A8X7VH45_BRACI|nr:hypothetical protein Bca52824_022646 [Brassica carinata]